MRFYHRHSFFPLVVMLLTLLLGAVMAFALLPRETPTQVVPEETVVDAEAYRDSLAGIVRGFRSDFSQAVDDAGRKDIGARALQAMLNLRVPAQYKSLHLALAVFMSSVESDTAQSDPLAQLQTIVQTYPWLSI